jgi:hypothetical protein
LSAKDGLVLIGVAAAGLWLADRSRLRQEAAIAALPPVEVPPYDFATLPIEGDTHNGHYATLMCNAVIFDPAMGAYKRACS